MADVAEYLGLDIEQVLEGLDAVHPPCRVDGRADPGRLEDEAGTRHDTSERSTIVRAGRHDSSLAERRPAVAQVDRQVLALRFRDGLNQSEIATQVGVSQMQVSRILRRVSDELRETADLDSTS